MGAETLVEEKVADALTLVKKLDELGEPPNFVAWYYVEDAERWRLLISSDAIDALLAKDMLLASQHVLEVIYSLSLPSISASDFTLVRSDSKLPSILRTAIRTEPNGFARASFFDSTFNGVFVEAVVILRSSRWEPKKGKSPKPSKNRPHASKSA